MIDLKEYFTDKPLNSVKHSTLLRKLNTFEIKYCKECDVKLKFNSSTGKTSTYCPSCVGKVKVLNMQKTIGQQYGVKNISQLKETQIKIKENNLKKYGVDNTAKLQSSKDKIMATNLKNHGVTSTSVLQTTKDKAKATNLIKYGKEYFLQTGKARLARKALNNKQVLIKDKNISTIEKGYNYKCDICYKNSKYVTTKKINIFLQRLRLGFLPCQHCLPSGGLGSNTRSTIEIKLDEEIKKLGIRTNHKTAIDIILPDYNLGIEVNGVYWHSDKFKDKNFHKKKILKNDMQLLFFTDYELIYNFETIFNYIKGKIGLLPTIGASKCKIHYITNLQAREFCDKYHIHGFSSGSKYYGMFLKEELVSVCIVGKNRFSKDGSIEIIRLANKTKIIGGFPRFLKRIKNDFKEYNKVTTFIDAYLGNNLNNVFTRNGFTYISHTEPNYNWFLKGGRVKLSRYQCMKHKLLKQGYKGETEDEIMKGLGGIKVYDGGNYKFELNY